MSPERVEPAVTVADLRPVDLFDDLDDEPLAEWAAVVGFDMVPGDVDEMGVVHLHGARGHA